MHACSCASPAPARTVHEEEQFLGDLAALKDGGPLEEGLRLDQREELRQKVGREHVKERQLAQGLAAVGVDELVLERHLLVGSRGKAGGSAGGARQNVLHGV